MASPLISGGTDVRIGRAGAMALGSTARVSTSESLFGVAGGGLAGLQSFLAFISCDAKQKQLHR